jgi:hypothetical protein
MHFEDTKIIKKQRMSEETETAAVLDSKALNKFSRQNAALGKIALILKNLWFSSAHRSGYNS